MKPYRLCPCHLPDLISHHSPLTHCSNHTRFPTFLRTFLPQGLCTCSSLLLEYTLPSDPHMTPSRPSAWPSLPILAKMSICHPYTLLPTPPHPPALFFFLGFYHHLIFVCVCACKVISVMCDPMDCSLPGSSVHGILQARILEWVAVPSSRGVS